MALDIGECSRGVCSKQSRDYKTVNGTKKMQDVAIRRYHIIIIPIKIKNVSCQQEAKLFGRVLMAATYNDECVNPNYILFDFYLFYEDVP